MQFIFRPTRYVRIVGTAISLGLMLLIVRAILIGWSWDWYERWNEELPKILFCAVYDVTYVACLMGIFLGLGWLLRDQPNWRSYVSHAFGLIASLSLLAGLANVQIVPMLGRPFNYQWLYYSDFLMSHEAHSSISSSWSWSMLFAAIGVVSIMLVLGWLIARAIAFSLQFVRPEMLITATVPLLLGYAWIANWYLVTQQWPMPKLENPVVSFATSYVHANESPPLLTMHTPFGPDDFRQAAAATTGPATRDAAEIRHVILYVMESTGSRYLDLFGGRFSVTPNLARLRDRAVLFDGAYAHAPATNVTMVSLLCSAYPWVSYKVLTAEHPDVPMESLAQLLGQKGYRTAFFGSCNMGFQSDKQFLKNHGFSLVEGAEDRSSVAKRFESQWSYVNGCSESDTIASLKKWIDADKQNPFFAMLWTAQTHHPYFVSGTEREYVQQPNFNRYLNAVRETDAALGDLMDWLDNAGLADDTLVVVVGDHGEAFGQHGQYGHGTALYEENLRVPLMLINRRLFSGQQSHELAGMVDVPATILDCLKLDSPATFQGRSLFDTHRSGRVYFCAPWSDLLFAYRENNLKFILNATANVAEVYDLQTDPEEKQNISEKSAAFVRTSQQRLASWVQYQGRFYDRILSQPHKPALASGQ